MQGIAQCAFEPAAIHAVIRLQVANGRLHRCSPFEPALLLLAQTLEFASVNDLPVRVVGVHAAKAQIDHDVFERDGNVLRQIGCLLQDRAQDVAVVGVAVESARPPKRSRREAGRRDLYLSAILFARLCAHPLRSTRRSLLGDVKARRPKR